MTFCIAFNINSIIKYPGHSTKNMPCIIYDTWGTRGLKQFKLLGYQQLRTFICNNVLNHNYSCSLKWPTVMPFYVRRRPLVATPIRPGGPCRDGMDTAGSLSVVSGAFASKINKKRTWSFPVFISRRSKRKCIKKLIKHVQACICSVVFLLSIFKVFK